MRRLRNDNRLGMKDIKAIRNPTTLLWLLLGAWWILNVIQAGFTELANDEAYYFMFSGDLAWGYFDHPPMTALLVRLGRFLGGELGVRFFFTLLQPVYLYLLWLIVRPKVVEARDVAFFALIASAMPILQLYGFIAVPDGPLMLFTALLLWAYKRFTESDGWGWALLMGLSIAALAYSKYHGALVVLLLVLSNLSLLKKTKFYAACLLAAVLILPHLAWQYDHDWVSFRYHLSGRNRDFEFGFVTEYILNLFAIFNPLLFPVFLAAWWKTRSESPVLRALSAIAAGFILFFLASTLRGYVQPQWEIPAAFGVIATLFLYARNRPRLRRYVVRVGWITLALVALVRIEMIFNPLGLKFEVFGNRASYGRIAELAQGAPVIFDGQYTAAAKYSFYTGGEAYAQPSIHYRTSQYELRGDDDAMAGRRVLLQVWDDVPGRREEVLPNGLPFRWIVSDPFVPVRRIGVEYRGLPDEVRPGDTLRLALTLRNPYPYEYRFDGDTTSVSIVWRNRNEPTHSYVLPGVTGTLPAGGSMEAKAVFVVPRLSQRTFEAGFTVANEPVSTWFNGPSKPVRVVK